MAKQCNRSSKINTDVEENMKLNKDIIFLSALIKNYKSNTGRDSLTIVKVKPQNINNIKPTYCPSSEFKQRKTHSRSKYVKVNNAVSLKSQKISGAQTRSSGISAVSRRTHLHEEVPAVSDLSSSADAPSCTRHRAKNNDEPVPTYLSRFKKPTLRSTSQSVDPCFNKSNTSSSVLNKIPLASRPKKNVRNVKSIHYTSVLCRKPLAQAHVKMRTKNYVYANQVTNSILKAIKENNVDCHTARLKAMSAHLAKLRTKYITTTTNIGGSPVKKSLVKKEGNSITEQTKEDENICTKDGRGQDFVRRNCPIPERSSRVVSNIFQGAHRVVTKAVQADSRDSGLPDVIGASEFKLKSSVDSQARDDQVVRLKSDIARLKAKINSNSSSNDSRSDKEPVRVKTKVHNNSPSSKYVWSSRGKHPSDCTDHFVCNHGKRVRRKKSQNLFTKQTVTPVSKVPLKKLTMSKNRTLHKTRSRFKIRKSCSNGAGNNRSFSRGHNKTNESKVTLVVSSNKKTVLRRRSNSHSHVHRQYFDKLGASRSPYKLQNISHAHHHSQYKIRPRFRLWNVKENTSFMTRRVQHMAAHSPMLFTPHHMLLSQHTPHRIRNVWTSLPRKALFQSLMQREDYVRRSTTPCDHQRISRMSKSSTKTSPIKKVMNVVKIGGVRYSRHGKSLQRLSKHSSLEERDALNNSTLVTTVNMNTPGSGHKITNTKIAAQQLFHRSLKFSRISKSRKLKKKEYCMFFNRFGRCHKGSACPYKHDSEKVAVCTRFLRGTCKRTDGACLFSHKVSKDKMPVCRYFLKGMCTQKDCPYSHVKVNNSAGICKAFCKGYCPLGDKCAKKHLLECAEFSQRGGCPRKAECPLWHKKKTKLPVLATKKDRGKMLPLRNVTIHPNVKSQNLNTSSFIQLRNDGEDSPAPSTSATDETPQPLQIRPLFLNKPN